MSTDPIPTLNPATATFSWTAPTENVDGTPVTAGEITGFSLGIRSTTASGSTAGTYPVVAQIASPTAVSEAMSAIGTVLKADTYAAAIRTAGLEPSAWSAELTFQIANPVPNPPGNFSVA